MTSEEFAASVQETVARIGRGVYERMVASRIFEAPRGGDVMPETSAPAPGSRPKLSDIMSELESHRPGKPIKREKGISIASLKDDLVKGTSRFEETLDGMMKHLGTRRFSTELPNMYERFRSLLNAPQNQQAVPNDPEMLRRYNEQMAQQQRITNQQIQEQLQNLNRQNIDPHVYAQLQRQYAEQVRESLARMQQPYRSIMEEVLRSGSWGSSPF